MGRSLVTSTAAQQKTAENIFAYIRLNSILAYLHDTEVSGGYELHADAIAKVNWLRHSLGADLPANERKIAGELAALLHPYVGD